MNRLTPDDRRADGRAVDQTWALEVDGRTRGTYGSEADAHEAARREYPGQPYALTLYSVESGGSRPVRYLPAPEPTRRRRRGLRSIAHLALGSSGLRRADRS